jgi:hypothetical protein
MSGSKLDFGDCYTGVAHSKIIILRNSTEAALHVELTSDRAKEVNFELKLQQNRARASRAGRADEVVSPTNSNEESSRKGSLSPEGSKTHFSFSNVDGYALDSDEEVEDNEVCLHRALGGLATATQEIVIHYSRSGRFLRGRVHREAQLLRRKPTAG